MNKYNSLKISDNVFGILLLISGALTLLFGGSTFYKGISILLKEGAPVLFKFNTLQLATFLISFISVPISISSLYFAYTSFRDKILGYNVFYFSTIQGIILLYPAFSAYVNPNISIKKGTITEKTLITSFSILGIILLFHILYFLYHENITHNHR